MMDLYAFANQIACKMGKYKLYRVLQRSELFHFAHFLFHLSFHNNPTQKMEDEKKFFLEHTKELKEAYNSLEDNQSRHVFENILKFRITYTEKFLKASRGKDSLKNQYLVPELQLSGHEIIVDCGAFTGDTVKTFYKNVPGCSVIALEPDKDNFEALQKLKLDGLKPIQVGAWSKNTTLSFSDKGGGTTGGAIDVSGGTMIEVRALDDLSECQLATYIKMDIEGAELEALRGAEKIIQGKKPKLAICIYHKPQDFYEIPLYIKKLNPDYKLFVHHHSFSYGETVLYAV